MEQKASAAQIRAAIRNIPDFPKPGEQARVSQDRRDVLEIDLLTEGYPPGSIDTIVGIDARGFIFAAAAALKLRAGFVPVRKKGKLPYCVHEQDYALEYGTNTIAIHTDALRKGSRVLLVDDLLATGGTAAASAQLVEKVGAKIEAVRFLIELSFLNGRDKLKGLKVESLVVY
jgi:adenine phosphoribosyltransferase